MSIKVGIIGAGAMGTSLSQMISVKLDVLLYARQKVICDDINQNKVNSQYFPNVKLNENIHAVNDYESLKDVEVLFLCIPSSAMREVVYKLNKTVNKNCIFVSTAKGVENKSNKLMSDVIEEIIQRPAVVLSGPNIASEMIKNYYSSTTIASKDVTYLTKVNNVLESETFKVEITSDVIGTEYCGIFKNVIAISQGICEGININLNARYAILTKSYNETKNIIEKLGGKTSTVDKYCGFGDIVIASTQLISRNYNLGILYGYGINIGESKNGVVYEGRNNLLFFKEICRELNIVSLTVNFVCDVIIDKINPKTAFNELWGEL